MKDSIVMNIFQEDIKTEIYPLAGYIHDIFTIFCSKQALQKVKPKKMSIYIKCLHQKIYTTHIVLWANKRRICQFPWSGYRPCPPCHLQKMPKMVSSQQGQWQWLEFPFLRQSVLLLSIQRPFPAFQWPLLRKKFSNSRFGGQIDLTGYNFSCVEIFLLPATGLSSLLWTLNWVVLTQSGF